jgi:maleylpyruvate isomerase
MPDPMNQPVADELLPEATRRLVRTADGLADHELTAPSGLPGWSRAHVLAHLALNAEALAGVLRGIVEGRRVPMYSSQDARDADIAELAAKDPAAIRSRLLGSGTELSDAIAGVPEDRWDTTVERVPGGRTFPAGAVPRMRLTEVEIHHADLAAGYDRASWSPELAEHVLDAMLVRSGPSTPFAAHATDLGRTWTYGEGGPTVVGTARDLAWWITGRGAGEGLTNESGALPQVGAW